MRRALRGMEQTGHEVDGAFGLLLNSTTSRIRNSAGCSNSMRLLLEQTFQSDRKAIHLGLGFAMYAPQNEWCFSLRRAAADLAF